MGWCNGPLQLLLLGPTPTICLFGRVASRVPQAKRLLVLLIPWRTSCFSPGLSRMPWVFVVFVAGSRWFLLKLIIATLRLSGLTLTWAFELL